MTSIRHLVAGDVEDVVARVAARLAEDHRRQPLVDPSFSAEILADALRASRDATWVGVDGGVVGHLYGARLDDELYGRGVWVGPDGASWDRPEVLADLYATAAEAWIAEGAREHFVLVLDDSGLTEPWYDLGFSRMHRRGVLVLGERHRPPPRGYDLRLAGPGDLDTVIELSGELDRAQARGPSFVLDLPATDVRSEIVELFADREVRIYLVEWRGRAVAQCVTFPLPPQRGSFPDTVHLSAVVVRPEEQGRGIGSALVDRALGDALAAGHTHADTNWRVTNRRAERFWIDYGFTPTYVRLHRTIGPY